ncbi:recombinase family protein [Brachybacterium sp. UMB0905]|uniref:recombinase family protein n=1 Tax=Brachybacterium sp. UMB0905 TaxID=2069310 RepID=UPI000C809400|nr:recombinase family protein [Brachybacterium sp. UMB0905]PMC75540.1 resolvase [Brachybacterium sp. UMB0905]
MSKRVIGYVRVSTSKQDIGPEVQAADLTAEAERRGWELELRREDAASASTVTRRPVLLQALADLKAGRADVLAVSKLDRLSRSVADFSRILDDAERQRWDVVCLDLGVDTTTLTGRAMAQVTATFAEMERRRIGERTRAAMATLPDDVRDRMRRGGRPRVLSDETAQRIRGMREQGMTLKGICEQLTADGVPTATGGKWWPATVRKILERA